MLVQAALDRQPRAILLADLDDAYKKLIWLTNRLSAHFLCSSEHVFLPSCTFDMLKHIDNAVCPKAKLEELAGFWSKRHKELEDMEGDSDR